VKGDDWPTSQSPLTSSDEHSPVDEVNADRLAASVIDERWRCVKRHQGDDPTCKRIIAFLRGDLESLTQREARDTAKLADCYALDDGGVLRYTGNSNRRARSDATRARQPGAARLVVPCLLQRDMLHVAHDDYQGGHQGINTSTSLPPLAACPGSSQAGDVYSSACTSAYASERVARVWTGVCVLACEGEGESDPS
jgi:hypothetical protein